MATSGLGISSLGYGFLGGATIPGGNIRGVPYSPVAVEFLPGRYLSQFPTAIPDTGLLSVSWWAWLPSGSALYDYFLFGPAGQSRFRMNANPPYTNGTLETFLTGPGTSQINVFFPGIPLGRWNHFFLNYKPDVGNGLWINGAHNATIPNTMGVNTLSVSGNTIELPDPFGTGGSLYSDFQCWFGTYIDPTVPYFGGGGSTAVNPQPLVNGQDRTALISNLVDAANIYGLPPTYPLTVADIENSYATTNPDPGLSRIFSFNAAEINGAGFNPPNVTVGTNATNQQEMNAFFYYNTVGNVPNSWLQPSASADPSGASNFLVFNMGAAGAQAIQNAAPGTLIQDITTQSGFHIGDNMLNQSWAKQGGKYGFPDALSGGSLVSDWVKRFNGNYKGVDGAWIQSGFDASTRVTPAIGTYLNAFIDENGRAVAPGVARMLFGQQSLLFTGKAANYPTNLGNGGPFTLIGGALIDYPLPPP